MLLILFGMFVVLAAIAALYSSALSGTFHFDDEVNLWGLERVVSGDWYWFVFGGQHLPFGRALALLSFVPQASSWPNDPAAFLFVNVLIHLTNTVLVMAFCYLLACLIRNSHRHSLWIAILAGGVWGVLPIHASASLMIVQRMTTLAASFSLLAMIAYLVGRRVHEARPKLGLTLIFLAMPLFTLAAMAAKEVAVMVPLYCLVIEFFLLREFRPASGSLKLPINLSLIGVFGFVLVFVIGGYFYFDDSYGGRSYDLNQRLLTQARVVTDYLMLFVYPRSQQFSPFHDAFEISTGLFSPVQTAVSVTFLISLLLSAWIFRKRFYVFSFSVFWFFSGHLLESTFIPLELYFEHRNYLPLIAFCFGIAFVLVSSLNFNRLAIFCFGFFFSLQAFALSETTKIWGDPLAAGELWFLNNQKSERALFFRSQQYAIRGDIFSAYRLLAEHPELIVSKAGLAQSLLHFSCLAGNDEVLIKNDLELARKAFVSGAFSHATASSVSRLSMLIAEGACPALAPAAVLELTDILLANPNYQGRTSSLLSLHMGRAQLYRVLNNFPAAATEYDRAIKAVPAVGAIQDYAVLLAVDLNSPQKARDLVAQWRAAPPVSKWLEAYWVRDMDEIDAIVEAIAPKTPDQKLVQ